MGGCRCLNTFTTLLFLAIVTYVFLDIHNSSTYERSNTNKYLTKIGVGSHVNRVLRAIQTNKFYKQTFLPAYNQFVAQARQVTEPLRKNLVLNLEKISIIVKRNIVLLIDFTQENVLPALNDLKVHLTAAFQKHVSPLLAIAEEKMFQVIAWLEKNDVFYQMHDIVVNFLLTARQQALSAVNWVSKNVQQMMA